MTLDELTAYVKKSPIRNPEALPNPIPETKPMDEERVQWISQRWWYHENEELPEYVNPKILELRKLLLSFGGQEVVLPDFEEDLDKILERGQIWYGDRIHMMRGEPCQCHRNSCYCWRANQDKAVICTGYALSPDGMWRQHSWLIELRPRKNKVVETTVPRIAYFGFAMDRDECWEFCVNNR